MLSLAIDYGPMEGRATCPHSNALSGTSGSGIVAGQKKAADLTGLPVPIISKLVDGLMHMARTNIDKRSRLLSAAVELTYQNGFEATSLADIAREAKVPLGNVYYYFKTKDEIGEAIVELRLAKLSAQRQRWNEAGSPKDRLCACVQGVFENKDCLAQLGCQVGTFCSELHKAGGSVATRATEIFAQHLAWIESQFRALGKGKDSNGLAVHYDQDGVILGNNRESDQLVIRGNSGSQRWWLLVRDLECKIGKELFGTVVGKTTSRPIPP